jgi:hypothetical protein
VQPPELCYNNMQNFSVIVGYRSRFCKPLGEGGSGSN